MMRQPQATDPNSTVVYCGKEMRVADVPDREIRAMLGIGHVGYGERQVVTSDDNHTITWPYTVENCVYGGDPFANEWINNGRTLVCIGCGLDGT